MLYECMNVQPDICIQIDISTALEVQIIETWRDWQYAYQYKICIEKQSFFVEICLVDIETWRDWQYQYKIEKQSFFVEICLVVHVLFIGVFTYEAGYFFVVLGTFFSSLFQASRKWIVVA